jgi:hypothetical protein
MEDMLGGWGFYAAPFLAVGLILYAVIRPRRIKLWAAGLGLAVGVFAFNFTGPLRVQSDRLFVQRHQSALNSLVADIMAYKRIYRMDFEYMHAVNGTFVVYPGGEAYSPSHRTRVSLDSVLTRDAIDPASTQTSNGA